MTEHVQVLDCTIRDGGYVNDWKFDKKVVREVYRTLSKSGVDVVEIGFRGTEKYFNRDKHGLWRYTTEEDIREVTANINGPKLAVMADFGKIDLDDFCDARDSAVSLVRIAAHKNKLKEAVALVQDIKIKGYQVSLNAMGYATCTDAERKELAAMLKGSDIDYIVIADSYGSVLPHQLEALAGPLLALDDIKVGFHAHNNLQMAFANTLEAIRCGFSIVDCSLYGMGRGPGNLPTEILLAYLQSLKPDKYNVIPVLSCIDLYILSYFKRDPWGYQLPYMMSGTFACHPYYAKYLAAQNRFPVQDIWSVLELVKAKSPVGYSESLVESVVQDTPIGALRDKEALFAVSEVPEEERAVGDVVPIKGAPSPTLSPHVSYKDRHRGKPFLVLGNGPSLKTYRDKVQQFIDRYDPIVLGTNYLAGMFKPHYHAFTSLKRFQKYVDAVDPGSRLLIGEYIPEDMIREYTQRDYETLRYRDVLNAEFSVDEAGHIGTNCRTISILLLGVALVMGASEVYAAGLDGYMTRSNIGGFLFYPEPDELDSPEVNLQRQYWCEGHIDGIDQYIQNQGREGVHILTPTSYKKFYKGLENYLPAQEISVS